MIYILIESISKMKSCPFCGCDDINVEASDMSIYEKLLINDEKGIWYSCWCNNCMASTSDFLTQKDAEEAWNKRFMAESK